MGKVVHGVLHRKKKGGQNAGKSKKNTGVGVDFKRVKHKVGKKLPKAQNETDASFKSHTINLPSQSVQQDKDGVAVNFQNLSLQELLNQTGHYSEKTRRQALSGLSDLFSRHPQELRPHLHIFLTTVAERVADGDAGVRVALRTLMRERVMPGLEPGAVRPFMPIIMAHVASAMTNLNMEVRLDALNFLDVLMDFTPEVVVSSFLPPCLSHFCDLLSQTHRGRNIKSQSVTSLLKVVTSLNSFLHRAFGGASTASEPVATAEAYPASSRAPQPLGRVEAVNEAHELNTMPLGDVLMWHRAGWASKAPTSWETLRGIGSEAIGNSAARPAPTPSSHKKRKVPDLVASERSVRLKGAGQGPASGTTSDLLSAAAVGDLLGLIRRLVCLLFDCWSECEPSKTVGGTPDLEGLGVLSGILSASLTLLNRMLNRGDVSQNSSGAFTPMCGGVEGESVLVWAAETVLPKLAPHFPATVPTVKPSPAIADALVLYNLQASRLLAVLLPVAGPANPDLLPGSGQSWVQTLMSFYSGVMIRGEMVPTRGMLSEASAVAGLATNASYLSVLQGVSSAVQASSVAGDVVCVAQLIEGVEILSNRMGARSPVRAACLRLQYSLMEACRRGQVYIEQQCLARWLLPLPKLIWEISDAAPDTSLLALRMMHDAARYTPSVISGKPPDLRGLSSSQEPTTVGDALQQIQRQLAPLFCSLLPAAASQRKVASILAQPEITASLTEWRHGKGNCDACKKDAAGNNQGDNKKKKDSVGTVQLVPGPLSRLPRGLQLLAVDSIYHLGCLDSALLKALHTAILDPCVFSDDTVALRLCELILAKLPDMTPADAADWVHSLLFPAYTWSRGTAAAAAASMGTYVPHNWDRQRAVVDRVCQMLPAWMPFQESLRLLLCRLCGHLLQLPDGAQAPCLTQHQRYSLLCLMSQAGCQELDQVIASGDDIKLKPALQSIKRALPSACIGYFEFECNMHRESGAAVAPLLAASVASSSRVPGDAEAADVVVQLLCQHKYLLAPLFSQCKDHVLLAFKDVSLIIPHSSSCLRATFATCASLLEHVLSSKVLQLSLLGVKSDVTDTVQQLVALAKESVHLSGDIDIKTQSTLLEQKLQDIYSGM